MVRKIVVLALMVGVALSLGQGARAASNKIVSNETAVLSEKLDALYTTIFRWDDQTVGALSPRERKITLFRLQDGVKGRVTQEIVLQGGFESSGGDVYPDIVQRHSGGDIFWLSRGGNRLAVYSPTGKLIEVFVLASDNYSWFEVRKDRSLIAYFNSNSSEVLGYEVYDPKGKLKERSSSWLKPGKKQNPIARMFFFELSPSARLEVLASFPYLRSTAKPATPVEIRCTQVAQLSAFFDESRKTEGLPRPLGEGYEGDQPQMPFILAAARASNDSAFLLANGGTVVKVTAREPITTSCWTAPAPPENFVPTSIASVGGAIVLLTRETNGQFVRLRAWNLAR